MFLSHIDEIESKKIENEHIRGAAKQVLVSPAEGWGDYVMRRFVLEKGGVCTETFPSMASYRLCSGR